MSKGKCIIFSAPSGSGKTTLVNHLLDQKDLNLIFSISATTRNKRDNETNKLEYIFLSKEKFEQKIKNKKFLEYEEVYEGTFYGTLKKSVNELLKSHNVIFDIDVEGGINLKNQFKENALSIFVKPPSTEELRIRLKKRNKDSLNSIETRLSKANLELSKANLFDEIIINDNLKLAMSQSYQLVSQYLEK
jgi:guanylate kinase